MLSLLLLNNLKRKKIESAKYLFLIHLYIRKILEKYFIDTYRYVLQKKLLNELHVLEYTHLYMYILSNIYDQRIVTLWCPFLIMFTEFQDQLQKFPPAILISTFMKLIQMSYIHLYARTDTHKHNISMFFLRLCTYLYSRRQQYFIMLSFGDYSLYTYSRWWALFT